MGRQSGTAPDEVAKPATEQAVTGRFTDPSEVADLVLLLASHRAGNVTGADFVIDGVPTPRCNARDLAIDVCRRQMRPVAEGSIGFELRNKWVHASNREIADLLIVDDRDACAIESYGTGALVT
jgi:hypothetical protein